MKFIIAGNLAICPDHIGFAERHPDGAVHLHMAMPTPACVSYPMGMAPPSITDHAKLWITPAEGAEHIWQSLVALSNTAAASEKMGHVSTNPEGKMFGGK